MAGVTSPMMIRGMEKDRNWLNRSEKVAKTRPATCGMSGFPPILTLPRSRARMIATRTHTRIPPLAITLRTAAVRFDMDCLPGRGGVDGGGVASPLRGRMPQSAPQRRRPPGS